MRCRSIPTFVRRRIWPTVATGSGGRCHHADMPDAGSAAEIIDAAARGTLIIVGSLPPHGRDLDLLARPDELTSAGVALSTAGFIRVGHTYARFRGCDADVVDLIAATRWLRRSALNELFDEAQVVPPFRRLGQPSPYHALLVLTRRLVLARGNPPDKLLRRIDAVLSRDPSAWAEAERRAASWRLERGLHLLRAWHEGSAPSRAQRMRALAELVDSRSLRWPAARRAGVIALSGIDGAGKSTQARSLASTMDKLGHASAVEWNPMSTVSMAIPRSLKSAILRTLGSAHDRPLDLRSADRARNVMHRQPAPVVHLLALATALVAVIGHWRVLLRQRARGRRVVIVDRYTLDASVHLRFRYGESRSLRPQLALLRWLSPRPTAAFLLDISPATAMRRKPHHWTAAEFELQRELYREELSNHRAVRLDAECPPEEICAQLAAQTWRRMG